MMDPQLNFQQFRPDTSTGTLKTKISLGQKYPQIVSNEPFYLLKGPPDKTAQTGATNLLAHYGLEHTYNKLSTKKIKEELSAFLPTLPGVYDYPEAIPNSTLRSVIEKPPIVGKVILPFSSAQLAGFRLHPTGPLPQKYLLQQDSAAAKKQKKKDKKKKTSEDLEKKHKKVKKQKTEDSKKKKKSKKQKHNSSSP